MNRLRIKLIVLLSLVALLPAVPMAFLVQGLMRRSLNIGVNARVSGALQNAFDLYKQGHTDHRNELKAALFEWLEKHSTIRSMRSFLVERDLELLEIFDLEGKPITRIARSDSFQSATDFSLFKNFEIKNGEPVEIDRLNGQLIQTGTIFITAEGDSHFVLLSRFLPKDFVAGANEVRDVVQIYKTLDLARTDLYRAFGLSFFIVYFPFLGIAILVALFFSRKVTKPLEQLAAATVEVTQGNWEQNIRSRRSDEIGQLINAFNRMVKNLKSNQEELLSLEKMAAWREIARVMAHEIKNPLTPIQLTVQQLRDKYSGEDKTYGDLLRECTDIIENEVNRLRTLVDEFSDFARMPELKKERCDLNSLLIKITKLYNKQNIQTQLDDRIPEGEFDHEKMHRVFINLIDNAVAASPSEKSVYVKSRFHDNRVTIEISDSGPGVPVGYMDKIFEPYFSTKHSGMGLGLAVVKKVIREHGGSIAVSNKSRGGAVFTIELPMGITRPAEET